MSIPIFAGLSNQQIRIFRVARLALELNPGLTDPVPPGADQPRVVQDLKASDTFGDIPARVRWLDCLLSGEQSRRAE